MTPLDPPAAAARRQWAIDRMVEHLIGWGCDLDSAPGRARTLLDEVLAAGYALPVSLQPAPARGGGSTAEGRAAARAVFDAARRAAREPAQIGAGSPESPSEVSAHPGNRPSAAEGADRC